MSSMKVKTKLVLGFTVPIVLTLINVVLGNLITEWSQQAKDQESFLAISKLATYGLMLVSIVITVVIALSIIKTIEKSVEQLSRAAADIATGKVDIELVKYHDDEFGDLVDEYGKVIENIRYQAHIAEEV